jgi:hypothetical protein
MFGEMMAEVQQEVVAGLFQFVIEVDGPDGRAVIDPFTIEENMDQLIAQHEDVSAFEAPGTPPPAAQQQAATAPNPDSAWSRSSDWAGTSTGTGVVEELEDRSSQTLRGQAPGAAGRRKKPTKKKRRG